MHTKLEGKGGAEPKSGELQHSQLHTVADKGSETGSCKVANAFCLKKAKGNCRTPLIMPNLSYFASEKCQMATL